MKLRANLNIERLLQRGVTKLKVHSKIVDMSQVHRVFSDPRCQIQTLDLSWCDLQEGGVKTLAKILKVATSLKNLVLQGCRLYDEDVIDIMRTSAVINIDLSYNKFGIQGISAIADNNFLQEVSLECNGVTTEGAVLLSRSSSIRSYNLDWNYIDSLGFISLASNSNITTLFLRSNPIGNSGARFIINNDTSLVTCKINGTNVGISISNRLKNKIKSNRRRYYVSSMINGDFSLVKNRKYNRIRISREEAESVVRQFVFNASSLSASINRGDIEANIPFKIRAQVDGDTIDSIVSSRGAIRLLPASEVCDNGNYPMARLVHG